MRDTHGRTRRRPPGSRALVNRSSAGATKERWVREPCFEDFATEFGWVLSPA
jgi:hypothetical protein